MRAFRFPSCSGAQEGGCVDEALCSLLERNRMTYGLHRVRWGGAQRIAEKRGAAMGVVKAVCTSEIKGIQKTERPSIELKEEWGIEGDAHAGAWHRQVSLLSYEKIEDFKARGADVINGSFGENIIVEGFDLKALPIGTRFESGDVVLELTQIGKECHAHCAIYHKMGDCIMPREGVFCRVIHGGVIAEGDPINIIEE